MSRGSACALDELRLIGAGGTNKVMAGELSRLVRRALPGYALPEPEKAGPGALVYPFDVQLARTAAVYHRTSVRVLRDLIESPAERLEPLFEDVVEITRAHAASWFWTGARISVYAHGVEQFAAGERQIIGTVKNGLIEGAAQAGLEITLDPAAPNLVFAVRGEPEWSGLRISIDLAGRPMNQRGYRVERGAAPLREDLAAVLLMLARYDPRRDLLIDPMAGSGTIAIEAACMAKALPVWVPPRRPMLLDMPTFSGAEPQPDGLFADAVPQVIASDVRPELRGITERAAQCAGVSQYIRMLTSDFRDLSPRELRANTQLPTGLILCNPPYGERVETEDLLGLYADLAEFCASFSGYRAAFLVANRDFERAFGVRPRIKKPLSNGPLRGYFYLYEF